MWSIFLLEEPEIETYRNLLQGCVLFHIKILNSIYHKLFAIAVVKAVFIFDYFCNHEYST
jgi:hypothetical protein